jgi:hypothetical protein
MSLGTLFTMSTLGASALFMVACSGKVIGGGGGGPQLESVSAAEINQPVVACGVGYAHSNACCEAAPGKPSSCGVYVGAPFQACEGGYTTYPDPRKCCPLDGSGDCVAPPPSPPPIPVPGCGYACPAGQYEPPGSPGTCCFDDGSTTVCSAQVGVTCGPVCECPKCPAGEACPACDCGPEPSCPPTPVPTPICSCPACIVGESCPPCDCGPTPSCEACPPGWQVPAGEPLLCCNDAGGTIECFSQGVPPTPIHSIPVHSVPGHSVPGHTGRAGTSSGGAVTH